MNKVADLTLDGIFAVGLTAYTVMHVKRGKTPTAIASGIAAAIWTTIFVLDARK